MAISQVVMQSGAPEDAARRLLMAARSVAVLTGAGVLPESGISTFRSNSGYWRERRFEDLATNCIRT